MVALVPMVCRTLLPPFNLLHYVSGVIPFCILCAYTNIVLLTLMLANKSEAMVVFVPMVFL